jgi:tRNA-dihydrouridine synthase 3
VNVDFVDINMGCPIDSICNKGMGSALSLRPGRVQSVVRTMSSVLSCPLTVKMRVGYDDNEAQRNAHKLIPKIASWGASAVTLHGRSRQQRYSRAADWTYISQCASVAKAQPGRQILGGSGGIGGEGEGEGGGGEGGGNAGLPLIGNGDVFSWEDVYGPKASGVSACMVARGALVKPWVFTEIKERRHWDISSGERLDILRDFTRYGLEHWGSDELGVARVRKFLLEWLSFLYRYVPVGLLERLPGRLQDRAPAFVGRNDLETLMASPSSDDWVKITELLLGPVPSGFEFTPKHKANAYSSGPIEAEG